MRLEPSATSEIWDEIAVFVLSVKTFDDRISSVRSQLDSLHIPFQFVFRFDVPDFDKDPVPLRLSPGAPISQKEISLVAKHAEAWRLGVVSGKKYALILEDDFILGANFSDLFDQLLKQLSQLSAGFLVNLGGANAKLPFGFFLSRDYFYPFRFETAEGYLSDQLALARRLSWLELNLIGLPADHLIRKIDEDKNTSHWWPPCALLEQGSLFGRFSSALDERRSQTVRFLLMASYWSKKFRRRILPGLVAKILK